MRKSSVKDQVDYGDKIIFPSAAKTFKIRSTDQTSSQPMVDIKKMEGKKDSGKGSIK